MSKKILIQVISAILFEILFFSLTLKSQTNFYDESFKLKQASESYDERGYLKNGHYSGDGNLYISDFDGNAAYIYPISSTTINGSEVNVNLNYSGSVGCTSFAYYDCMENKWRTLNKNRAAWILGVNGFAVQVFGEANFFTNKPHINGLTWDIFHNSWTYGTEPDDPWYSKTSHTDADINWVIDGYDYSNSMATAKEALPFQDVIKLLKSDGSILELRNVAYLRSTDNPGTWADEKYYTGTYYENAPDAKGFAIVEFIKDDFNIEIPQTVPPYSDFTDNAYDLNKSPFWPRRVHYFPGDGMEYVFREYTMPYGREILFVNDPTGDYPLANCNVGQNAPPENCQYYRGKKLGLGKSSFGANWATPTIFYLDEIHNKYRKIADFTYSRHHPWPQQMAENMHDYTRGRALLKSFLNHKITYSSNYATIETPTHSFTLSFGTRKISGWDPSVEKKAFPDDYYYTKFDEYSNASQYMSSLDRTENYYSWLDYITQISEKDVSSTTDGLEKQTNFEYETYTRNYKGLHPGDYQYYFPKVLAPYGLADNQENLNMTINDYRLSKVINPDHQNTISYKEPASNILELPLQSSYSGDFLYSVNNTAQEMDKYDRTGTTLLLKSEYDYFNVGRSVAIYDPAHDGCFALCTLKVTDMVTSPPKVIQKQTWYENFMLTPPATGVWPTQFLYKTNLLKNIETSDGVTRTNWNVVYHPTATNDRGQSLPSLNMIFLLRYTEEDIQYTNSLGVTDNIVKSCSSFDYQLSQKYNTNKIRDYGSNDYQSGIYDAFGFDILEQTQSVWNPLDVSPVVTHPGRPLTFKNGSQRLIVTNKKMFSYLPYKNNVAVTVNDQIFNFDKTLKEFNRQLYGITPPSSNILGKSLEETICFVEQNDPVSLTSKTFPPVFGILKSDKTYDYSRIVLLTGTSKDINETPNSGSSINYGYGNETADYIISKSASSTIKTKELDYTTGYKFGGLINSITAPNSAVTNLYYDYNDAHSLGYWPVGNAPQPDICSPGNAITGLIKTNKDNSFITRLKQGLYQYYTAQPYVNKQTVRKYQNGGSSLATTYIANIFNYDPNGNIIASLDPNGWLSALTYDIYGRNQQINLPLDFIDPNNISGKLPLPLKEQLVIRNSGITRFSDQSRQVQCTTCYTNHSVYFTKRTAGNFSTNDNVYDMLNLSAQAQSNYFAPPPVCTDDQIDNCTNIDHVDSWTENITPVWYGSVILAKPANMASITSLDPSAPVMFRVYIDRIIDMVGAGVWLTVNFPDLSYGSSFQFEASTSLFTASGDGFLDVQLPSNLNSAILSLLNGGTGIKVELKVTTDGGKIEFSNSGYDKQPALILNGTFNWNNPANYSTNNFTKYDYTLQQAFDFSLLESHRYQKIDDAVHSNNTAPPSRRELNYRYTFGHDYKVLSANRNGGNNDVFAYFGNDLLKTSTDKNSQTTSYVYDETGRNTTMTYPDNAQTTFAYKVGKPSTEFSLLDEDYYGYCYKKTSTDNKGTKTTQYYDAFDRLRKEVTDEGTGALNKTIQYQYDLLGRLTRVINPKSQTIRYWYDGFGRIKYKYQADIGVISYAYDNSGNVRFSQNEEQSADMRVTYYEYDDLNRLLVMGEAKINNATVPTQFQATDANFNNDDLLLNRLTDVLDPNTLHFTPSTTLLTDNKTLWLTQTAMPGDYLQLNGDVWPNVNCVPVLYKTANQMLGIDAKPQPPLLMHSIKPEDDPGFTAIADDNFENLQSNPQSLRMVSYYDALPPNEGSVWGNMPTSDKWNAIAPTSGTGVRNLKGKVSAIAYREHGGQPFNFMVFSYDERGRVEAMLRYTQNLTYDAVYYKYNSNNDVISVRSVDPARSYNAWYGYDDDGRLQNIWSAAPQIKGFCGNPNYQKSGSQPDGWDPVNPSYSNITPVSKPTNPDVGYTYNTLDLMSNVYYYTPNPSYNLSTTFTYNSRKWVTRILAIQGTGLNFDEQITYDANKLGLISSVNTHQFGQSPLYQNYTYDNLNQLTHWGYGITSPNDIKNETIVYDIIGNRTSSEFHYPPDPNPYAAAYTYNPSYAPTPNGISTIASADIVSSGDNGQSTFTYNQNGGLKQADRMTNLSLPTFASWEKKEEKFHYDVRGLVDRYTMGKQTADGWTEGCWNDFNDANMTQWSYWYNPFGEREQKRTYRSPAGDFNGAVLPWTYYQLGIKNQQYVVYNGFQISDPSYYIGPGEFCLTYKTPPSSNVFIYPTEYNIYGSNSSVPVSYTLDANGVWQKTFKIFDHIGSVRQVVSATNGVITGTYDYEPFGRKITNTCGSRTTFIGKEKDNESGLGDFGVRKYDFLAGRFTSPDPLWEKYVGLTPYQYAMNSPIIAKDDNGNLTIFANGYNGTTGLVHCGTIFSRVDHFGGVILPGKNGDYWGTMPQQFAERTGDNNILFINGSDRLNSSAEYRYNLGIAAGSILVNLIKNKQIPLATNEPITIVTHSQGTALGEGMSTSLTDAGYTVEASYNMAPKQAGEFISNPCEDRTVQYGGSHDIIAPQVPMSNSPEPWILPNPDFWTGGHFLSNYFQIFDILPGNRGYVAPSNNKGK